ncbi:MAG: cytochrome b5 domain-containing protein [Patescibacteria group bacterium]
MHTSLRSLFIIFGAGLILVGAGCSKTTATNSASPKTQQHASGKNIGVTINPDKGSPAYTSQEIGAHATSTDCWLTINNRVYDVTTYLKQARTQKHIVDFCGKDATQDLSTLLSATTGSSSLANFEIGTVEN